MTEPTPSSLALVRFALLICVAVGVLVAVMLGGCSSGDICYRKTDCATGSTCQQGACVRQTPLPDGGATAGESDAGVTDAGGGTDPSQTPDAN